MPRLRFPSRSVGSRCAALAALALAVLGCQAQQPMPLSVVDAMYTGEYGEARQALKAELSGNNPAPREDRIDRDYLLNRLRLLVTTMADGYAPPNLRLVERIYDILRTQGINRDKTVASVVLNEDLKIWKGEPFEQALALHYIGVYQAMNGGWDNTRAATLNSLFQLRDFGADAQGRPLSREEVLRRAQDRGDADLSDYRPVRSDFTLGYLMAGVANQQLGLEGDPARTAEAEEYFTQALATRPALRDLVDELERGEYNTVLVIDYGRGPAKVGTGADDSVADFVPQTPSDDRPIRVLAGDRLVGVYPWATDLNRMAQDARWNSLEGLRRAKSLLGTGLMAGGAGAAVYGAAEGKKEALYAGIGMLGLGLFSKAGAHADVRHLEVMPQRVYVVPLRVEGPEQNILVQVEGDPGSRLVLTGITPPRDGTAVLRYVRLLNTGHYAPPWATSGQIVYSNDHTGIVRHPPMPYILGGNDVRKPTEEVLASYRRAGVLRDTTLQELRDLYRAEGIHLELQDEGGLPGMHVLEGGASLEAPLPGTLGFARLFGVERTPYRPRSQSVQQAAERVREELRAAQVLSRP